MFAKTESNVMAAGDVVWELDSHNSVLSYTKMKYI